MMVRDQRDDSVRKDNRENDGEFYPEQIDWACTIKGIKEGTIERIEWMSGEISETYVIWCKGFPFWNLVTGVSRIRVELIWGEDRRCRSQAHILWPDTKWSEGGKGKDALCWMVYWILT